MRFPRGAGYLDVELLPEQGWVVTFVNQFVEEANAQAEEPDLDTMPEGLRAMFGMGWLGINSEPQRPASTVTRQVSQDTLLMALTEEEARLLLGYCSHVCEQVNEHLEYVLTAMREAFDRKNIDAMHTLLHEMHEGILIAEQAREMATYIINEGAQV